MENDEQRGNLRVLASAHGLPVPQASERLRRQLRRAVTAALDDMRADAQRRLDAGVEPMVAQADLDAVDRVRGLCGGCIGDAKDADEASLQAAFWRARAVELGASEDEYRNTHRGQ